MQNARRTTCGKTTTANRVDAAVIHYFLYRALARAVSHQLGQRAGAELRPEHRAEARERRGAEPVPDTCQTEEEGNNCARDRPWQHGTAGPGKERGDAGQRASPRVLEPPPEAGAAAAMQQIDDS